MEAREIVARVICLSAQVMCVSYLQAAPWEEFPVFDLADERFHPAVSGHLVVCESTDTGRRSLKLANVLDLTHVVVSTIQSSGQDLYNPAIAGNTVVWHYKDDRWTDRDIGGAIIANSSTLEGLSYYTISNYSNDEINPTLADGVVSYQMYDPFQGSWYLRARYFGSSQSRAVWVDYRDVINPATANGALVWQDNRNGDWDIYGNLDVMNPSSFTVDVHVGDGDQQRPAVSGSTIVWESNHLGRWGIFGVDRDRPEDLIEIVSHAASDANAPAIAYNKVVVWQDNRHGHWDIFGFNLTTGVEFRITDNEFDQMEPAISYSPALRSSVVVWQDNRQGHWEIYGAVIDGAEVAGARIHFVDSQLREILGDPTPEELSHRRQIYAPGEGLSDLTGLEYATGLENLLLPNNQISDLSPLTSLTQLEKIFLGDNLISDVSPLAGLVHLEELDLYWNRISDISPLAGLTSLETLVVTKNQIRDLPPLAGLDNLWRLWLWKNEIRDISSLADLHSLRNLDISDNQISDVTPLVGLNNLVHLLLENNWISDINALAGLTQLKTLDLSNNLITDISPLVGMTHLTRLDLDDNPLDHNTCSVYIPMMEATNPGINLTYNACNAGSGSSSSPATTIYVDVDAVGDNSGTNWEHAYRHLQDALAAAESLDKPVEIRVAQGVYRPDEGKNQNAGDRQAAFALMDGVTLKGGYAGGGEPDPNARDTQLCETTLSGDLLHNDSEIVDAKDLLNQSTRSDNSYSVVVGLDTDHSAVLHGFTVTGGHQRSGVYIADDSGATISDCWIVGNMTSGHGGGMYCGEQSTALVIACEISNNAANDGGAMMTDTGSTAKVLDCVFSDNYARADGGAVYVEGDLGSPAFVRCAFENNRSGSEGGGIYIDEGTAPALFACSFLANHSIGDGGGIYCDGESSPTILQCRVRWNFSGDEGGGIDCEDECSALIANCIVGSNEAEDGAGIFCDDGSGPIISHCVITGNRTYGDDDGGGGIYCENSTAAITNCTIVGNTSINGGGVCCDRNGSPTIANCIVWNNRANQGPQIALTAGSASSTLSISYSDVQGGFSDIFVDDNCILNWNLGNINLDPVFADPGHWDPNGTSSLEEDAYWVDGDYYLQSQTGRWDPNSEGWVIDIVMSPCVDAGDPNSPVGDEPVPNGDRVNIGAYGGTAEASKSSSVGTTSTSFWSPTLTLPPTSSGEELSRKRL